jgi:hypothetical protein
MAASKSKPKGRPKGAVNRFGATAKENIAAVFTRLGGTAAMADWAKEHPTDFYKLYARLLPLELAATGGGTIVVVERDPTQRPDGYRRKGVASE